MEIAPHLLAMLNQSSAQVDTSLDKFTNQVRALVELHGPSVALADFNAFLRQLPADQVAVLAAGAIVRLATQ